MLAQTRKMASIDDGLLVELPFICMGAMIEYYSRKNGRVGLFKEANNNGCED